MEKYCGAVDKKLRESYEKQNYYPCFVLQKKSDSLSLKNNSISTYVPDFSEHKPMGLYNNRPFSRSYFVSK